jgi:hypothetical protein
MDDCSSDPTNLSSLALQNFNYLITWSDLITRSSRPTATTQNPEIRRSVQKSKSRMVVLTISPENALRRVLSIGS